MIKRVRWLVVAAVIMSMVNGVSAGEREAIETRLKKRHAKVMPYKETGKVGETREGLLEAVKPEFLASDAQLSGLIKDENADRKRLYEIIAEGQDGSAGEAGIAAAREKFKKAAPHELFKSKQGAWMTKQAMLDATR